MADEIVIRDDAGTEHVFPAGFDVQKAISIVRGANYKPDPTMQAKTARIFAEHAGALPMGYQAPSEKPEEPSLLTRVGQMLEPLAHPSSVGDIAGLLMPNALGAGETSVPNLVRGTLRAGKAGYEAAGGSLKRPLQFLRGAYAEVKRPLNVERYAPNVSDYSGLVDPREPSVMPASPEIPPPITQGVYTKLPDGSYGVKALPGYKLTSGEPVNVMSRAGQAKMVTAGSVGPDGIATLGDAALPAAPQVPVSYGGSKVTDPRVLDLIRQRLMQPK